MLNWLFPARERIADSALAVMHGQVSDVPTESGMCLAFVRVVIQHALKIDYDTFYSHGERVESAIKGRPWWARDMERGLRKWAVRGDRWGPEGDPRRYIDTSAAKPGDLLFRWDTAKNAYGENVGHVGIYLGGGLLIENIDPAYRRNSAVLARHGSVCITPLNEWPVTSIVRWRR